MGIITSCCRPSASDVLTPDAESRRRQQVEAAERRRASEAARGLPRPEQLPRARQKAADAEKREQELAAQGGATLKWTSN